MPFSPDRYATMQYRRCGRSGLLLPAISLGGWQAIGGYLDDAVSKRIFFTAFDHGITHFDFANNYGVPPGTSEELFGRIVKEMPRHELVISTKANARMWPGPYGEMGSRKHMIDSCEQSLKRLDLDHVDIFYSHGPDFVTPLEETMGAIETLVRQGKALYIGVSNYVDPFFTRAVSTVRQRGWPPITITQPCYNMFLRDIETCLLPSAGIEGVGVIAYSPLARGLLSDKYLNGIPSDSRAANNNTGIGIDSITAQRLARVNALNQMAKARGQSLAQMALAWLLKDQRVTSVLIGASKPEQIGDCVGCLSNTDFAASELAAIDRILAL